MSLRIVVTGLIAQYPLGGVTWFHIQYLLGLARLGHDVYYLEDSGQWPYNPLEDGLIKDPSYNADYLAGVMSRFGLEDKWAYRLAFGLEGNWEYRLPSESQWFGLTDAERKKVLRSADLLINVSGTLERPQDYRQIPRLVYIDTDPVFTQIKLAHNQDDLQTLVGAHDVHFSYGECIGSEYLHNVPATGHTWIPTRPPVVLSEWDPSAAYRETYTTVMNWTSHDSVTYNDQTYGQKDVEFMHFIELPGMVAPTQIELAIGSGKTERTPYELLTHKGWHLVDPARVCPDVDSFRTYTESSKGEWSVAKNGYVLGQSGWFSERSARYLAAGRPVMLQDTGYSSVLPTGEGLLAFTTLEEAADAIHKVEAHYDRHAKAAREIAEAYFDATGVLTSLIEEAFHGER
jgi:hypothetical protein